VISDPSECQLLQQISDSGLLEPESALLTFVKTHLCICKRVKDYGGEDLRAINRAFARRFAQNFQKFERDEYEDLHIYWIWAFTDYREEPHDVMMLVAFAFAHIMVDLRHVLCLYNVEWRQYVVVNDHTDHCMRSVAWPSVHGSWESAFVRWLSERMEDTVQRTILMPSMRYVRRYVFDKAQEDRKERCKSARQYEQMLEPRE
jgi:hypothetical protein